MRFYVALLLDYFAINCAREKRNFIHLYLVFLCICSFLTFKTQSQFIYHGVSQDTFVFTVAFSVTILLFALAVTAVVHVIFACFLAYSLAFRRAHALHLSVGTWLRSEDYNVRKRDFLKVTDRTASR